MNWIADDAAWRWCHVCEGDVPSVLCGACRKVVCLACACGEWDGAVRLVTCWCCTRRVAARVVGPGMADRIWPRVQVARHGRVQIAAVGDDIGDGAVRYSVSV